MGLLLDKSGRLGSSHEVWFSFLGSSHICFSKEALQAAKIYSSNQLRLFTVQTNVHLLIAIMGIPG